MHAARCNSIQGSEHRRTAARPTLGRVLVGCAGQQVEGLRPGGQGVGQAWLRVPSMGGLIHSLVGSLACADPAHMARHCSCTDVCSPTCLSPTLQPHLFRRLRCGSSFSWNGLYACSSAPASIHCRCGVSLQCGWQSKSNRMRSSMEAWRCRQGTSTVHLRCQAPVGLLYSSPQHPTPHTCQCPSTAADRSLPPTARGLQTRPAAHPCCWPECSGRPRGRSCPGQRP